jgi:SAM-dependent methyltransferase
MKIFDALYRRVKPHKDHIRHKGHCPLCEHETFFVSKHSWLRDHFICQSCQSIPRERALFKVLSDNFANYQELKIHESSPVPRGTSTKLMQECPNYSSSQYFPAIAEGAKDPVSGIRCENLERLSFPDNSFDLFITQDVMEHIFNPEAAFKEIARVLKPGGAHIFTVPIVNKRKKSERWASFGENGEIVHHHEPEYHGNPVDPRGSLVTMHWGYDIASYILEKANMPTVIIMIDNIDLGIRAELIDVLISWKRQSP